jgi:hypothetical protein
VLSSLWEHDACLLTTGPSCCRRAHGVSMGQLDPAIMSKLQGGHYFVASVIMYLFCSRRGEVRGQVSSLDAHSVLPLPSLQGGSKRGTSLSSSPV